MLERIWHWRASGFVHRKGIGYRSAGGGGAREAELWQAGEVCGLSGANPDAAGVAAGKSHRQMGRMLHGLAARGWIVGAGIADWGGARVSGCWWHH